MGQGRTARKGQRPRVPDPKFISFLPHRLFPKENSPNVLSALISREQILDKRLMRANEWNVL